MSDVDNILGLVQTESIQIHAEAYDVALDMSFPKGTIHGQFKVYRQANRRHTHRQIDRQIGRQTEDTCTQADRQTNRQTVSYSYQRKKTLSANSNNMEYVGICIFYRMSNSVCWFYKGSAL